MSFDYCLLVNFVRQLLENAKKEAETLKTKLNFMITLEKITEERRDLENEFVWAGVSFFVLT